MWDRRVYYQFCFNPTLILNEEEWGYVGLKWEDIELGEEYLLASDKFTSEVMGCNGELFKFIPFIFVWDGRKETPDFAKTPTLRTIEFYIREGWNKDAMLRIEMEEFLVRKDVKSLLKKYGLRCRTLI